MKSIFSKIKIVLIVSFILVISISQVSADVFWEKTYDVSLADRGCSVQQTADGSYIVAGLTALVGAGYEGDILLIKMDSDGSVLWSRTFGGNASEGGYGSEAKQTADGGYIIVSSTRSFGSGSSDVYLIKTDSDGIEEWSKTYGENGADFGCSVQQTHDSGYVIVGFSNSFEPNFDYYIIKTDSNGNELWSKSIGGAGVDRIFSQGTIQQTSDDGFIIVGSSDFYGAGGSDIYLIKTDSNGNVLWSRTFGGSEDDNGHSVQQTTDGGYIIAGYTGSFSSNGDGYLIKTDPDGNELWSKILGSNAKDTASSVQQTTDGGYVVTGFTENSVYLTKTDAEGNEHWSKTFGGEAGGTDYGESVQQTTDGGYIIAGTKLMATGVDDVYLIYYKPESICALDSKFEETTIINGLPYYTDRTYQITSVPSTYVGMDAILTPNDDRNRTDASDYLTFKMPFDGTVYVAFDSRAKSLPDWMNGFSDTGDIIKTSLSTQPCLRIYVKTFAEDDCVNFGANKAPGFTGVTVSNYLVFYCPGGGASDCSLDSRFAETTMNSGITYYTDRSYTLTKVPSYYGGMETILTPNDDRNRADAADYLTFKMPYDGVVYVAFDCRAISEPNWMDGFIDTGDVIKTSLSTQPCLKIYRKTFVEGACVNFGANKAPGFSGDTVSNYIVMYAEENGVPVQCALESKFETTPMQIGVFYYTDRNYTITGGVPDWMLGRTLIQTPNDDQKNKSASGYIRFKNPVGWWVYVLFDSRSASVPDWLNSWDRYTKYPRY
jgi:hypothetical protein